jgi:glycosyltransferase involved in cell wall biosynthesis
MKPIVSIICITYNQAKYISQTLESLVMQETNFPFEIIVHDDASTDGTQDIIKEFVQKYPKIFRPLLEKENQYSSSGVQFLMNMYEMAKGKYIAVCEGDDYWTDPKKLQIQVDFLDKNQDYSVVFHPVRIFFENGEAKDNIFPDFKRGFTVKRLLQGNFIQTNSVMYRARPKGEYAKLATDVMPNDWYIHLFHAQFGKIGFIDKVMSTYRRHDGGVWWAMSHNPDVGWKDQGSAHFRAYEEFYKLYGSNDEYRKIILNHVLDLLKILRPIGQKYGSRILDKIINRSGYIILESMSQQDDVLQDKQREVDLKQDEIDRLYTENQSLRDSLKAIHNSKFWKYATVFWRLRNSIKKSDE